MSYTTHVNFRADDITDGEYETAISELETVDGVEVEDRKQDAAMVANSDAGTSLALMAGTLAVTGVDTLGNIYKLASSNPSSTTCGRGTRTAIRSNRGPRIGWRCTG